MKPNRDNWATPANLYSVVDYIWRPNLDVCALRENAKCSDYLSPEVNGLEVAWSGVCWCNPPGSEIAKWTQKALAEVRDHNVAAVVLLAQAGVGSRWYHAVAPWCETILLTPRPQFVPPPGVKASSNARDYVLLIFTPGAARVRGNRVSRFDWERFGLKNDLLIKTRRGLYVKEITHV